MANLRKYPRGRPHTLQRLWRRTPNFGTRRDFMIMLVFATLYLLAADCNGSPMATKNSAASSSVFAVVTIVMSIPRALSTLS
jgi:hypothetical protein